MKEDKDLNYDSMTIEAIEARMTPREIKFIEQYELTGSPMLAAQYVGSTSNVLRSFPRLVSRSSPHQRARCASCPRAPSQIGSKVRAEPCREHGRRLGYEPGPWKVRGFGTRPSMFDATRSMGLCVSRLGLLQLNELRVLEACLLVAGA